MYPSRTSSYGILVFVPTVSPSETNVRVYFCLSNLMLKLVEFTRDPACVLVQPVPLLYETALKPSYFSVIVNVPPAVVVTVLVGVLGQLPSIFCL